MQIIIYSETTAASIAQNIGKAEYSYYFVLEKYLPALEKLGKIIYVSDPAAEVDAIYDKATAVGEKAVFLSFSPPHRTEQQLRCPTVCVLAWEFSSVPDESWDDDPRDNWVQSIRNIGNLLTLSQYSTDVIRSQVGGDLNIATVPAPVTNAVRPDNELFRSRLRGAAVKPHLRRLSISAEIIDTSDLDISEDIVLPKNDSGAGIGGENLKPWDGEPIELGFDVTGALNSGYRNLVGFHDPEEWGAWARSGRPWISLPALVAGDVELEIDLIAFADNVARDVLITLGDQTRTVRLDEQLTRCSLSFNNVEQGASLKFSNIEVGYTTGAELVRALSIGVARLRMTRSETAENCALPTPDAGADRNVSAADDRDVTRVLEFDGLVYTSIFNPEDGRKNWDDIVTAFCWAFRDQPDKTLILKFNCRTMSSTWGRLFLLFSRLSPFKCRIVVVHGFLSNVEMAALVEVSDYIVNSSRAEGQCLPLLEFMAKGVPAVAPDHTAMSGYINKRNAFIVESSLVATCFPHDPREYERTMFYRIDWSTLLQAFIDSAEVAQSNPARYRKMAYHAAAVVSVFFSQATVLRKLETYLAAIGNTVAQDK
jgi:glycosyltransferase involved in cell wall biosynthesis